MADIWALTGACAAGTYLWRGLGVLLSGRLRVDGQLFVWVTCVAYAMVAGLISRIVLMPSGMLATSALPDRLVACVIAVLVYRWSGRNLFVAVGAGVLALIAFGGARALV
jgi:branched-subunit amino acid transport protein